MIRPMHCRFVLLFQYGFNYIIFSSAVTGSKVMAVISANIQINFSVLQMTSHAIHDSNTTSY